LFRDQLEIFDCVYTCALQTLMRLDAVDRPR